MELDRLKVILVESKKRDKRLAKLWGRTNLLFPVDVQSYHNHHLKHHLLLTKRRMWILKISCLSNGSIISLTIGKNQITII